MDSSSVKVRFSSANNIDVNWIVRLEETCVSRGWPASTYETVIDSSQGIGCSDNTSSRIPEPKVSGETEAMGYGDTVKYVGHSIGTLQEMCMSQRWPPPTYNIVTDVGPEHARVFTIACSIMYYRVLAASKMLICLQKNPLDRLPISMCASNEKLGSMKIQNVSRCSNCNSPISTADSATSGRRNVVDSAGGNDNIGGNPIGCFQEIHQFRRIPLPIYKFGADVGPPCARVFTIACYVSNYTALGVALNIKRAKHLQENKN